jgi:hypothetical protein
MKVKIEAECTPEEARAFLGLPDVTPFNKRVVDEMTNRLQANGAALKPEELLRSWMSLGGAATEQFRGLMQTVLSQAAAGRPNADKGD